MKTRKNAHKRFKRTGKGKLVFKGQGQSHLATKKTARRGRRLSLGGEVTGTDKKIVERLLGNR